MVAEARGRTSSPPVNGPNADQRDRVDALRATLPDVQWFMAWLWLRDEWSLLDFFDPGEPGSVIGRGELVDSLEARHAALWNSASGERIEVAGRQAIAMRQGGWPSEQDGPRTDIFMAVFSEFDSQAPLALEGVATPLTQLPSSRDRFDVAVGPSIAVVMDFDARGGLLPIDLAVGEIARSVRQAPYDLLRTHGSGWRCSD